MLSHLTLFLKRTLPTFAFLLLGGVSVALWQEQIHHERQLLQRHTETAIEQLRARIEAIIRSRLAAIELLADRWVERYPSDFSHERFVSFARALFRRYPGLAEIKFLDAGGGVRWTYFQSGEPASEIRDSPSALQNQCTLFAFKDAQSRQQPAMAPCSPLLQGRPAFQVLIPLIYDGSIQGYLNGIFSVDHIMTLCLPEDILNTFQVVVREDTRAIYWRGSFPVTEAGVELAPLLTVGRDISVGALGWHLSLAPLPQLSGKIVRDNFPVLLFGLGLSLGFAILLRQLIRRIDLYRVSRDRALHEVAERRRVEEALRENEEKREALLKELSAKNAEMESFVYIVSHDLKAPIVTIEGFVGALHDDYGKELPAEAQRYLKYMSDAARKMESLINDLLNLSRIGRVPEAHSSFSLRDVVEEAAAMLQPQLDARGIRVQIAEDLPEVYGERKRIMQVVDNLLSNAVKYMGPDQPAPCIRVGVMKSNGASEEESFFIEDNGIGIEGQYFEKIFQIFQRLPSSRRMGEGTGVGLTIVRRIIQQHGGRIWLTSEPGKGTTFFFTLKYHDEEA